LTRVPTAKGVGCGSPRVRRGSHHSFGRGPTVKRVVQPKRSGPRGFWFEPRGGRRPALNLSEASESGRRRVGGPSRMFHAMPRSEPPSRRAATRAWSGWAEAPMVRRGEAEQGRGGRAPSRPAAGRAAPRSRGSGPPSARSPATTLMWTDSWQFLAKHFFGLKK
jgi:hypothetical protein